MNSLGENEFCETNVKEGAKRTNNSLSFLFGSVKNFWKNLKSKIIYKTLMIFGNFFASKSAKIINVLPFVLDLRDFSKTFLRWCRLSNDN
jgi:hypothetical protein